MEGKPLQCISRTNSVCLFFILHLCLLLYPFLCFTQTGYLNLPKGILNHPRIKNDAYLLPPIDVSMYHACPRTIISISITEFAFTHSVDLCAEMIRLDKPPTPLLRSCSHSVLGADSNPLLGETPNKGNRQQTASTNRTHHRQLIPTRPSHAQSARHDLPLSSLLSLIP